MARRLISARGSSATSLRIHQPAREMQGRRVKGPIRRACRASETAMPGTVARIRPAHPRPFSAARTIRRYRIWAYILRSPRGKIVPGPFASGPADHQVPSLVLPMAFVGAARPQDRIPDPWLCATPHRINWQEHGDRTPDRAGEGARYRRFVQPGAGRPVGCPVSTRRRAADAALLAAAMTAGDPAEVAGGAGVRSSR